MTRGVSPRRTVPAAGGPASGAVRVLRVGVLGSSSLILAVAAHLAGGGTLPSAPVVVGAALLVGLVAARLTGAQCRLPAVLAILGFEQFLLHGAFDLAPAPSALTSCAPAPPPAHHAAAVTCHAAMTGGWPSLAMILGHVVATVVTAWLLTRGEARLWRLADSVLRAALPTRRPWPSAAAPQFPFSPLAQACAGATRDDAPPRAPPAGDSSAARALRAVVPAGFALGHAGS